MMVLSKAQSLPVRGEKMNMGIKENESIVILERIGLRGPEERKAVALAIKALEKQVPMEWIDDGHHLTCPMCETNWTREELLKYCGDCGQRLKT